MTPPESELLEQLSPFKWRIPKDRHPKMRVDGIIYASPALMEDIFRDQALNQVINVAQLPGIIRASLAMPDIHWGYGFPIGGVAAFDMQDGIVSPGGVGYDINCGVRLLRSNLLEGEVAGRLRNLIQVLYHNVPAGVGREGRLRLKASQLPRELEQGSHLAIYQ